MPDFAAMAREVRSRVKAGEDFEFALRSVLQREVPRDVQKDMRTIDQQLTRLEAELGLPGPRIRPVTYEARMRSLRRREHAVRSEMEQRGLLPAK